MSSILKMSDIGNYWSKIAIATQTVSLHMCMCYGARTVRGEVVMEDLSTILLFIYNYIHIQSIINKQVNWSLSMNTIQVL